MKKLQDLTNDQLNQLAAGLRKGLEYRRTHLLESFVPYPKQREFFNMGAAKRERLYQAGNQFYGKTTAGAVETTYHLTGRYPDDWGGKRWDRPTKGWALGESAQWVRDQAQSRLCGNHTTAGDPAAPDWGTGFIPKELLISRTLAHGAQNSFDNVSVRHISGGTSLLGFRNYEQGRTKLQGATLDFVWPDEVPPDDIYGELLARITTTRGIIFVTFTPMKGSTKVTDRFNLDDTVEALADRGVVRARREDIIGKTPEEIEQIAAGYEAHERAARMDGEIMQGEGAVWEKVNMDQITVPHIQHSTVPLWWPKIWGIDFGIGHPFAAVLLTRDPDTRIIYVLHEIKIADALPATHIAMIRAIAPMVPVAWPHDGSHREKSAGEELYKFYQQRNGQPGLVMRHSWATMEDGGYSTHAGIKEIHSLMLAGKFLVSQSCLKWFHEARSYHWKDGKIVKINDDLMSATRQGVMDIRFAKPVPLGPSHFGIFKPQVRRQAREIDIFTGQPLIG